MNTINMKKLNILESLYRRLVYRDPMERLALTRWVWRKLATMYDMLEPDF